MGMNLVQKIIADHLVWGKMEPGEKVAIKIDQTLLQDATGTMAFLEFEAMGLERVQTEISVQYVDHNMAQFGPENHNDHLYLQSIAAKTGVYFSRAGNGICHQVHLERFARPGGTLLGSDSHTPTCGGMGMLAIGVGGLDVALAMGGAPFVMDYPKVIGIRLTGKLQPWVAAKDIIFKVLEILTTKGNVGCILEYFGPGVQTLSVPERATITNMGAEVGVTTSIFPSDERTREYLEAQDRAEVWKPLAPDPDAQYDRIIEINLDELEPLTAAPSSPDNIKRVRDVEGIEVHQVLVGSCTNSSLRDLMIVARILEGRRVHPNVQMGVTPGSRQVFEMIAANGALATFIAAGCRILESACGPCIGQGLSPGDGKVSVRTFNRNFKGRSGTMDDYVYLASPETAAACALTGRITDPRDLPRLFGIEYPHFEWPRKFWIDDSMIIPPAENPEEVEIIRGPTIGAPPENTPMPQTINGKVLIKVGDKITTDHIMPAGPFLKYRSNIPEYAKYVFYIFNEAGKPTFAERALEWKNQGGHGIVVGGESYGQGSSREHAAICPMYLGVKAKIAKSFERIHRQNLINFGIAPLVFADPSEYDAIEEGDLLRIENFHEQLRSGQVTVHNVTKDRSFACTHDLSADDVETILLGGKLNQVREQRRKQMQG
ncbi:MAG: aconitate hydratase [Candidatus Poribacteria bacterium]|nr:MAG: aconitate hydratase [Candidatus Poribacteria bacterium]